MQCKYSESIDREAGESFLLLPHKLSDPESIATQNPRIYPCSCQYNSLFDNNYDVYMAFVFIGENRPEYSDKLKSQFLATIPSDSRARFTIEVIGINELITRYLAKNPYGISVPENKILRYKGSKVLEYSNENVTGLIATVSGRDLAQFGESPEMFLANFRFFLNLRNRVNSTISDTVQNSRERKGFWAFNNGVTIVCDKFDPPDSANGTVKLYRPQIVNGCQTASILNRPAVHRFSGDVDVLVRIIATDDNELKQKIATYTNTQTKVSDRTLRSNDPVQKSLQRQFSLYSPPYFYDCKEGEWNALTLDQRKKFQISARAYRRLINTDCAKAYIAFHGKPIEAKSSPRLFWDLGPSGLYAQIFPNSRGAPELLLPYLVMQSLNKHVQNVLGALPAEPTGDDALKKEYLVHCDTTVVSLAGYIIKEYLKGDLSIQNLTLMISKVSDVAQCLFQRCDAAVKYEFSRTYEETEQKGEIFNARNYFLKRGTFTTMTRKVASDIELIGQKEYFQRCGLS